MTEQRYENHAHHPVPTYVATVLALAATVCVIGAMVVGWPTHEAGVILMALTLWPLIAIGRVYTVKLQDRIIQLEMQIRCARVLAPGEDELLTKLSPKHIVALRFASDAELGPLLHRAVDEGLTPDAIKRAVTAWRPDTLRT